jgi:prepilin-type N-terminal cleavage/methylation domain-containing protein
MRRGVTLIELLFVVAVLAILLGLSLSAYSGAVAQSRAYRTRAVVTKLDQLIADKIDGYLTRAVPIRIPANASPAVAARVRLDALRELMKLEMPDRINDVNSTPSTLAVLNGQAIALAIPSLQKSYRRRVSPTWSAQHEGAECLYLIVAAIRDGENSALSFFSPSEIGDVDGDGMREILDAFGQPIEWLRWAPGYSESPGADTQWGVAGVDDDSDGVVDNPSEFGAIGSDDVYSQPTPQTRNYVKAPDPFDPLKIDPRWRDADASFAPFYLKPLIFSAGADKEYDITTGPLTGLDYATTNPRNDPYLASSPLVGSSTGTGSADNITNHDTN